VKDTTSLVSREKGFIKITYEHPRDIIGLADVHEVIPKIWAMCMVRTGIDACAGGGNITTANIDGYRELVGVEDGGVNVTGRMLE